MIIHKTSRKNNTNFFNTSEVFNERSHMKFFYVGLDEAIFEHLINHFESGYKEAELSEAGKLLHQFYLSNNQLPDVIFIDLSLNEEELKKFASRLKHNILLGNIPVIYNEKQLSLPQINRINQLQLIDDIITLDSNRINYLSKIMFIKQSKIYNQIFAADKIKTRQKIKYKLNLSNFMKRLTDIVIALFCILMLLPILLLIAIAIKLESRGPIFYTASRAGKGFKVFKFYKFRSMVMNADKQVDDLSQFNQYETSADGPMFFKVSNDPRITKFGKLLRNTSADELPQLLNVLKGDMSLVGNRPLPIYEAVSLTTNEFVERFAAPAGITGLWQVNKRGKADMSIEERINLDIAYSRNYNFLYDLRIMARTPVALFQKSDV